MKVRLILMKSKELLQNFMDRNKLPDIIDEKEFLYRGIIEKFWDYENNRPSSAIFKDSKGVSVDRDYNRSEKDCINSILANKDFFSICKIQQIEVNKINAITKYLPIKHNIYHSEIHNSNEQVQLKGSKPKKLRDKAIVVFHG